MEVILAISCEMFASCITALGYAVQKKAHMKVSGTDTKVMKTKTWWLGIMFMFIGIPFNILSLMWADQSLLSCLAPFAIIFALILGRFMLKEKLFNRHYIAATCMVFGSMVALSFASKHTAEYGIDEIIDRLFSKSSLATLVVNLTLMALFMIFTYRIISDIKQVAPYYTEAEKNRCLLKFPPKPETDSSTKYSIQQDENILDDHTKSELLTNIKNDTLVHDPKWLKVGVFALPWFAGFMSGLLALSAKCSIMLAVTMSENNNYASPFTYVIFLQVPCFVVCELSLLNIALRMFDTCYVIPIFKASMVFHNTMCGGILLQEFFTFKSLHLLIYALGIFICILGILVMLVPPEQSKQNTLRIVMERTDSFEPLVSTTASEDSRDDTEETKL